MKRLIPSVVFGLALLLLPGLAWAQQGTVTGTVTEAETGDPLPGATVQIPEEGAGAATGSDGQYRITGVPSGERTLRVSFVGFQATERTVNVPAGGTVRVNFELQPQARELGEVVVTGQGSAIETKRLSSTTETVSAQDLEEVSTGRLDQALQSQLPNTQIRLNSGQPGTSSLIRSRGPVSISGNTTPVIYIDGVRVDNRSAGSALDIGTGGARSSSIADIPQENIERIEFVKGGAATTLYGSDAANGVIQIFTKDGTGAAENQLNFETRLGAEYGTDDFFKYDRTGEVVFQDPAFTQSYKLSGTGGTSGINYSFSGKMYENNAARVGNENIRYDLNVGVSATPIENLQYSGTVNFVSNRYTRAINANSTTTNLRTENETFPSESGGSVVIDSLSEEQFSTLRDSLQRGDELYDNTTNVRRWQTSQTLRYNPVESLTLKLTGGLDYRVERNKEIVTNQYNNQIGSSNATSSITDFNRNFLGLTFNANLNHQASLGSFSFRSDIGTQIFRDETVITRIDADNVPDGSQTVNSASETSGADDISEVAQVGIYAKENIGFNDFLFLDLGLRADQNQAFGDDVGTVYYPAIGGSVVLTDISTVEEAVPSDIFSNLKLRANYGESGNFPDAFANATEADAQAYLGEISYTFGNPGAEDLGPSRTKTIEYGADLSLFQDRVTFQVTRYSSETEDALFSPPFPATAGRDDQQLNLGAIENTGWEFSSEFAVLQQTDYSINLSASLNTNNNEVTDTSGKPKFLVGGFTFLGPSVQQGNPVSYLEGSQPVFNEEGRVVEIKEDVQLGDPNPDQFGSLSLSARYKGLSVRATADYQMGAQGVATTDVLRTTSFNNTQDADRFPDPNPDESLYAGTPLEGAPSVAPFSDFPPALAQFFGVLPSQLLPGQEAPPAISSFFDLAGQYVEDTDYLKVRNITLNYRIPERVLPGTVRSVRLGASVQNPFNFVESSFDPEVTGSGSAAGRVGGVFGYRTVSPPRRYTFTLNVGL